MPGFSSPRIVAVIDVGSNSVRLLVARSLGTQAFEVVDEEQFDARLGSGQLNGAISAEGMDRGLRALRIVSQVARSHAPTHLIAAGTEALRRATNADEFVDRVRTETGVSIQVLSGYEEAFAGFLGVVNSTSLSDGHILDIGGGSLELMDVTDRRLQRVQSAPLGALYAAERFLASDPPTPREVRALRKAVRSAYTLGPTGQDLVGVGGAVRNIARMIRLRRRYPLRRLHGFVLTRRDIRLLAADLNRAGREQRRRLPGINANRVDTLHAAATVIDEVMEVVGAPSITVSGQGLREGIVWQVIREDSKPLPDVRSASLGGLARANGVDELVSEPVVVAAADLFDVTRPLHGLDAPDRELLLFAARLATIGMHIDYYGRDRHAEYLVHSGDVHGFAHREIVLLAALVRHADAGFPDLGPYRAVVEPSDARRAAVLAALLGVARAVRRRHPSPVHEFRPQLRDAGLKLRLTGGDALEAELQALEASCRRLENVLKTTVSVSVRPSAG